jgi:hypothetical protein
MVFATQQLHIFCSNTVHSAQLATVFSSPGRMKLKSFADTCRYFPNKMRFIHEEVSMRDSPDRAP